MRPLASLACLLLPSLLLAQTVREALLDRTDNVARWSLNPGREFPGATGAIAQAAEAKVGPCLKLDYDFTGGGNYVTASRELDVPQASAVLFSVRQEGGNRGFVRIADASGQEHMGSFAAGKDWQRVSLSLDAKGFPGHYYGKNDGVFVFPLKRIIIGVSKGGTATGTLYLQNLAFLTAAPTVQFGMRLSTPDPGNVAFVGKGSVALSLAVENRLAEPTTLHLRGTVQDWYGVTREFRSPPLKVLAHSELPYALPLSTAQPDYYLVQAQLLQGDQVVSQETTGVVVAPRPLNFGVDDPASFFAIQLSGDPARVERIGCKWVRVGRDWRWADNGTGNFWLPDLTNLRRNHQLVMYNLTAYPPAWALKKAPEGEFWESGWEERAQWWATFVEHCAHDLAADVDTFEIQNEPDLTCMYQVGLSFEAGVERYLRILRAGAAAVRKGAPRARLAGIDVSGGDYDRGLPYSEAILAQAGDLLDVYTGHPYAGVRYFGDGQTPLWPVANQERRKCQDTLRMLRAHGGKQKFWIGEKGWGLDVNANPLSGYSRDFAACLVQSLVLAHSVPGVERYFWFLDEGCDEHGYEYGLFRRGRPLPAALAYATLARLLHHATPVRSPDLGQLVQAHCFRVPETGQTVTVLWSEQQRATVSLARLPDAVTVLDLMGRPLSTAPADKPWELTLDRTPVYVTCPIAVATRFAQVLTGATVTNEQPLVLEAAFVADLRHLGARLRNVTNEPQTAVLTGPAGQQTVTVEANATRLVPLPVSESLEGATGRELPVSLQVRRDRQQAAVRVDLSPLRRLPAGAAALPPLDWWQKQPALVLDSRGQVYPPDPTVGWKSPEDMQVRAWLGWDDRALHFVAVVRDPVHFVAGDDPWRFWQSDSVQLALDPLNDAGATPGFLGDDREFGLVLGPNGARALETVPERRRLDVPVAIVRQGQDTTYQVALPWDLIGIRPQAGRVLGLSFLVNQNNGQGRQYWMSLTPGIGEAKRPVAYKDLYLAE